MTPKKNHDLPCTGCSGVYAHHSGCPIAYLNPKHVPMPLTSDDPDGTETCKHSTVSADNCKCACCAGFPCRLCELAAPSPQPKRQRWEYDIATCSDQETWWVDVAAYGQEGWEMVTVTPEDEKHFRTAYFKRPL